MSSRLAKPAPTSLLDSGRQSADAGWREGAESRKHLHIVLGGERDGHFPGGEPSFLPHFVNQTRFELSLDSCLVHASRFLAWAPITRRPDLWAWILYEATATTLSGQSEEEYYTIWENDCDKGDLSGENLSVMTRPEKQPIPIANGARAFAEGRCSGGSQSAF